MNAELRQWHMTTFADYQRRRGHPRREWWAWCGQVARPCLDVGCGIYPMPGAVAVDLAFGDVIGDALALPFVDGAFTAVVSSHLIEHVDPWRLLAEVGRVLRPGGRLYIEAPNLMGLSRARRMAQAGIRDARYPCAGPLPGLLAYRYLGRVIYRRPCLDVDYPGKDPDAVWWCNSLAVLRLLWCCGFCAQRVAGLFGHTFRIEAICGRKH